MTSNTATPPTPTKPAGRPDFLVIGGGIIGLTIARELRRHGLGSVTVLEKEPELGRHQSGKNSGVLHAGIYYAADSLKAKFCAAGSRKMQEYAREHGIACKKDGKVIVAARPDLVPQLEKLLQRSQENGIRAEKISPERLRELEPLATTHDFALWSPDTAVIDSKGVLDALARELRDAGVTVRLAEKALAVDAARHTVRTAHDEVAYGHLVNAAGLHADRIAHSMGVGLDLAILPFKGMYQAIAPRFAAGVRASIYPTPDPRVPFLGVHLTRNIHGDVLAGPTALPAFGRENYHGLAGVGWRELPRLAADLARMFVGNIDGFRNLAYEELPKYTRRGFFKHVRALTPSITLADVLPAQKVGIRAQLVERATRRFVMDFTIREGPRSTHVLNAISPAFTSSMAFAEHVVDRIAARADAPPAAI